MLIIDIIVFVFFHCIFVFLSFLFRERDSYTTPILFVIVAQMSKKVGGLARKYRSLLSATTEIYFFFLKHGRFDQCSRSLRSSVNNNRDRYDHVGNRSFRSSFLFLLCGRFDHLVPVVSIELFRIF